MPVRVLTEDEIELAPVSGDTTIIGGMSTWERHWVDIRREKFRNEMLRIRREKKAEFLLIETGMETRRERAHIRKEERESALSETALEIGKAKKTMRNVSTSSQPYQNVAGSSSAYAHPKIRIKPAILIQNYKKNLRKDHKIVLDAWMKAEQSPLTKFELDIRGRIPRITDPDRRAKDSMKKRGDLVINLEFRESRYIADRDGRAALYGDMLATKQDGDYDNVYLMEFNKSLAESQSLRPIFKREESVDPRDEFPATPIIKKEESVDPQDELLASPIIKMEETADSIEESPYAGFEFLYNYDAYDLDPEQFDKLEPVMIPRKKDPRKDLRMPKPKQYSEDQAARTVLPSIEQDTDDEVQQQSSDESSSPAADFPMQSENSIEARLQLEQQHQDLPAQSSSSPAEPESSVVEEDFDSMSIDSPQNDAGDLGPYDLPLNAPTPKDPTNEEFPGSGFIDGSQNEPEDLSPDDLPLDAPTPPDPSSSEGYLNPSSPDRSSQNPYNTKDLDQPISTSSVRLIQT